MNKMSEEEIIKNLNDLLEHNYLEDVGYLREENDYVVYNNAIRGLLDLYQKEKEKNKELSTIKEGIQLMIDNGIVDEQYIVLANSNLKNASFKYLLDNYISKDKIIKLKEDFNKNLIVYGGRSCGKTFKKSVIDSINLFIDKLLEEK